MILFPSQMITELRDWLDEPSEGYWKNTILMGKLNSAQGRIVRDIAAEDSSFFIATTNISFTAGEPLYDLPRNAPLGTKWDHIAALDTAGNPEKFVYDYRLRDHVIGDLVTNPSTTSNFRVAFQNDQLRVTPTPAVAETNAFQVFYIPVYGDMHEGTVSAATTTTLTFPTVPTYSQHGTPSIFDDYYNGMSIVITSGTGVGQVREVTDYTGGSTFQATVADWTTTPDSDSGYAVISPTPELFHEVVALDAAFEAAPKSGRRRLAEITSLRQVRYTEMLGWVHTRQSFRQDLVLPDLSTGVF